MHQPTDALTAGPEGDALLLFPKYFSTALQHSHTRKHEALQPPASNSAGSSSANSVSLHISQPFLGSCLLSTLSLCSVLSQLLLYPKRYNRI